jgi:hypothetical protein
MEHLKEWQSREEYIFRINKVINYSKENFQEELSVAHWQKFLPLSVSLSSYFQGGCWRNSESVVRQALLKLLAVPTQCCIWKQACKKLSEPGTVLCV